VVATATADTVVSIRRPATIPTTHPENAIVLKPYIKIKNKVETIRYDCPECPFSRLRTSFNQIHDHGLLKHGKLSDDSTSGLGNK
jgi:hypothetical protein